MKASWAIGGILLCMAVVPGASRAADTVAPAAERTFEIYPVHFTDTALAAEAVEALLADGDRVVVDTSQRRLVVITDADRHRKVAALLGRLDRLPPNIMVEVSFLSSAEARQDEIAVDLSATRTRRPTTRRVEIQPRVGVETTRARDDTQQSLLVASGREGYLFIGEEVPHLTWLLDYGYRMGILRERVVWERAGALLNVAARVVDDGPVIHLRLTPELRGRRQGSTQSVRFTEAAIEVTATDGETLRIGGLDRDTEFYRRFLIGRQRGRSAERLDILLTPRIMPAGAFPRHGPAARD